MLHPLLATDKAQMHSRRPRSQRHALPWSGWRSRSRAPPRRGANGRSCYAGAHGRAGGAGGPWRSPRRARPRRHAWNAGGYRVKHIWRQCEVSPGSGKRRWAGGWQCRTLGMVVRTVSSSGSLLAGYRDRSLFNVYATCGGQLPSRVWTWVCVWLCRRDVGRTARVTSKLASGTGITAGNHATTSCKLGLQGHCISKDITDPATRRAVRGTLLLPSLISFCPCPCPSPRTNALPACPYATSLPTPPSGWSPRPHGHYPRAAGQHGPGAAGARGHGGPHGAGYAWGDGHGGLRIRCACVGAGWGCGGVGCPNVQGGNLWKVWVGMQGVDLYVRHKL